MGYDNLTRRPAAVSSGEMVPASSSIRTRQALKYAGEPNKSTRSDRKTVGNDDSTRSIEGAAVSNGETSVAERGNTAYFSTKDERNAKGLPQRAAETDRREKPGRRGETGLGGKRE